LQCLAAIGMSLRHWGQGFVTGGAGVGWNSLRRYWVGRTRKKVDDGGEDEEVDDGGEEVAVADLASVDVTDEIAEVQG
jgi:hypothetical protein